MFVSFMNADGSVKSTTEIGENTGNANIALDAYDYYGRASA